jgi:membrane-bound metal-dependent hydrolase YbcI (DUF457 family)
MIAGHFGFAAGVKSVERQTPLWALMLATAWLDVIFVPLYATGIEWIEPAPGTGGGYGAGIIHADYTHSLVGALVLSALFGAVAAYWWGRRTGFVLSAVAFSHWLLDLVVHRGDMPILPGGVGDLPRFGFGLWRLPYVSLLVELILVVGGAFLYWRAARAVVTAAGSRQLGRADLAAGLILASGVLVLVLDFTAVLG